MVQSAADPDMTFELYLRTIPDVGNGEDFSRIEGVIRDIDLSE